MKNSIFLLLFALLITPSLLGQKPISTFEKAIILKKNNDSLNCLLELNQVSQKELAPLGDASISYKTEDNPKIQSIKIADIRTIKSNYATYVSIPVDKSREFLFKVAIKGKVSLLEYPKISIQHVGPPNGGHNEFGPKEIRYYAIKTNDKTIVIKQKKDLNEFSNILESCPEAKAIANEKFFKMEDLALIVNKLNECK